MTIALSGDYGKPRPAIVVQSDALSSVDSALIVPLTSRALDVPLYRFLIQPGERNGLKRLSAAMIEKLTATPRAKLGPVIGSLNDAELLALDRLLALVLGLGEADASAR